MKTLDFFTLQSDFFVTIFENFYSDLYAISASILSQWAIYLQKLCSFRIEIMIRTSLINRMKKNDTDYQGPLWIRSQRLCTSYVYSRVNLARFNFERETSNERRCSLIQNESQTLSVKTDNFLEFRVWKYPIYNFNLTTYK